MFPLLTRDECGCEPGECGDGAIFQFGIGAGADPVSSELPVGDPEGGREDGDRQARLSPVWRGASGRRGIGSGAVQDRVDLIRDTASESTHHIAIGELLGSEAGKEGDCAGFPVRIRSNTIRCSALLPCRAPPRERR